LFCFVFSFFFLANEPKSKRQKIGLKDLHVDGFDAEQIWEELQLRNTHLLNKLENDIENFQENEIVEEFDDDEEEEGVDEIEEV